MCSAAHKLSGYLFASAVSARNLADNPCYEGAAVCLKGGAKGRGPDAGIPEGGALNPKWTAEVIGNLVDNAV